MSEKKGKKNPALLEIMRGIVSIFFPKTMLTKLQFSENLSNSFFPDEFESATAEAEFFARMHAQMWADEEQESTTEEKP
jgi:hypothetical protein